VWSPSPFAPDTAAVTPGFVLAGIGLGVCSGLVPGLHANNVALLLAAVAPSLPGPPRLVGTAIVAAGVVHTFLDVVPSLALGVPDPAMAASALPGHRLVLEGRSPEALRPSAIGSATAVVPALPLALPMTELMVAVYSTLRAHLPLALGTVVAFLVLTERGLVGALHGALAFSLAAGLGLATLDLEPAAPFPGSVLAPLFAGLFGAPVLIEALAGEGVPRQEEGALSL
jgi:putative membrane protein